MNNVPREAMKPAQDLGTSERNRRQGGLTVAPRSISDGGFTTSVGAQAIAECVLDALYVDGKLHGTQGARADRAGVAKSRYEQGKWLRELFIDAGLVPQRAANLNSSGGGRGGLSDSTEDARAKFNRVVRDVLKAYGNGTISVVCFDQIPNTAAALDLVQRGLDRLCEAKGA